MADADGDDKHNATGELMLRAFGPVADSFGLELAKLPTFATSNLARLAQVFSRKNRAPTDGRYLSARLFRQVTEEAAWADDEIIAEYLGGVLASSGSGLANDRGVGITALIRRLSAVQLRAHYLLYSELLRLAGPVRSGEGVDFRWNGYRMRFHLEIPLHSFLAALNAGSDEMDADGVLDLVAHVVQGLARESLIDEDTWDYVTERPADVKRRDPHVAVHPSPLGIELFMWGCGSPVVDQRRFFDPSLELVLSEDLPTVVGSRLGDDEEQFDLRIDGAQQLLEAEALDELEDLAIDLLRDAPSNAAGYFYLAAIRFLQGRDAEAAKSMKDAADRATRNQREAGLTTLDRLMIQHPSRFDALLQIARILEQRPEDPPTPAP